jgi:molybdopterin molybdotransferase
LRGLGAGAWGLEKSEARMTKDLGQGLQQNPQTTDHRPQTKNQEPIPGFPLSALFSIPHSIMLTVEEALQQVLEHAAPLPASEVLLARALGLMLAEDIASDIDSPPHDKALVDGYAIRAADMAGGQAEFHVLEQITAGQVPEKIVGPGQATQIMTGAPMPAGADTVVMVEYSERRDEQTVLLVDGKVKPNQNIMRRAESLVAGTTVLYRGAMLRPIEIGVLAEVGRHRVLVQPRPTVACLATGNELVEVHQKPAAGMIRNSNGPMLSALVAAADAEPVELGIARDELADLTRLIRHGLESDVLLLSGGVSAGVLDLVPSVLAELGVREVFHKVNLKPGKPLWFGVYEHEDRRHLVFGLPGNPVSTLVCFHLFVRPALDRLANRKSSLKMCRAQLACDYRQRGDRPTFHPAKLHELEIGTMVETVPWLGSGDLAGLVAADALAIFPTGQEIFVPGEMVDVMLM